MPFCIQTWLKLDKIGGEGEGEGEGYTNDTYL